MAADGHFAMAKCPTIHPAVDNPRLASAIVVIFEELTLHQNTGLMVCYEAISRISP